MRSTAIMTELIFLKSLVVRFLDLLKTSQFNLCPCILSGSVLAEEKHCMNEVRVSRDGGLWWGWRKDGDDGSVIEKAMEMLDLVKLLNAEKINVAQNLGMWSVNRLESEVYEESHPNRRRDRHSGSALRECERNCKRLRNVKGEERWLFSTDYRGRGLDDDVQFWVKIPWEQAHCNGSLDLKCILVNGIANANA